MSPTARTTKGDGPTTSAMMHHDHSSPPFMHQEDGNLPRLHNAGAHVSENSLLNSMGDNRRDDSSLERNGTSAVIHPDNDPSSADQQEADIEDPRWDIFFGVNRDSRLMTVSEQKACILMSELFLDTELSDTMVAALARHLHALQDLTPTALERLFVHDVFPVFWGNLAMVAGQWQWVDGEWLLGWIEFRRRWRIWSLATAPIHHLVWLGMSEALMQEFQRLMRMLEEDSNQHTSGDGDCWSCCDRFDRG